MYFPGSSQSSALYHTPVKPSKKSARSADEMIENERQPAKAFLRLNSLEDESDSKMPITETPKRPHSNKHRSYHRSYHLQGYFYQQQQQQPQPTPHNPWWWHQQQFQAFHSAPLSHYQLVPYNKGQQYWAAAAAASQSAACPNQAGSGAHQQQQTTESRHSFQLVNNFLPELSFADHAAMAAAAMESTVDHPPPPPVSYTPSLLSSQISKTFASIVGGVCSWVAGTLEARLGGAGPAALTMTTTTTLNPNAKSFVPLNPHAKEFHPKGTAAEPQQQQPPKTPETEPPPAEMKPAGERGATPWVTVPPQEDVEDSDDDDDFDSPIAAYVSSDEDSEDEEGAEDEADTSRVRQVSVGSDDSDYIVFGVSDDPEPAEETYGAGKSHLPQTQADKDNCDNPVRISVQDFIVSPADAADEDEVDTSVCDDILSVFQAQLCLDKLSPCLTVVATSTPDDDHRIRTANRSWNDHYDSPPAFALPRSASKVCFAPSDANTVIYENPELAEELTASRQSDFPQRQADKERMERLIGPILTETHRDRVRNRLLGLSS